MLFFLSDQRDMDERMADIEERTFCHTTSEMEEEDDCQSNLCFLGWPVFRHPHHLIIERSLLHQKHHHHHVGGRRQGDNSGPTVRACLWSRRVIGTHNDIGRYSLKDPAAPCRLKQAFFLIIRRLNTAGRTAPPTRWTVQFLYNPRSYAFNFVNDAGSGRFVDLAQRFAPPEKMKKNKETRMTSQVPGLVQLL